MTDWSTLARPVLAGLSAYDPGASSEELRRRYGVAEIVRLNRNEDLFEPFPGALEAAAAELANVSIYPEESYREFAAAVAEWSGTTPDRVIPGHGIQALIGTLAAALIDPGDEVVVARPSYGLYAQVCSGRGASVHVVALRNLRLDLEAMAARASDVDARIVWVCDPNNPTGSLVREEEWRAFLDTLPERCAVIADEAYGDYADPAQRIDRVRDVHDGRPIVVLRTFSKLFGLAGLRLGYAIADPSMARILNAVHEPFNVNRPALAAGLACLRAPQVIDARRRAAADARALLTDLLEAAGIETVASQANFVLALVGGDERELAATLAARDGLLVRPGSDFGIPGAVRITVGPLELMERVVAAIGSLR
jgi:histidinol-phosphate aminotransferase